VPSRAAGGLLEFSDPSRNGPGERAFLVTEQFGFKQVFGNCRAIDRYERLLGAVGAGVDVARQHLLAGAGFAGDHDRGVRAGDLLSQLDHLGHRLVAVDHVARIIGDGGEHRGDQFRIGRQRDVFLGTGVDRGHGRSGVVGDAAGDDRHVNVFGLQPHHQIADVEGDVDQQQVGALAAAQHAHGLFVVLRMGNGSAVVHRDLGGRRELALQCANDEKPHGNLLFVCSRPLCAYR
jgi:hypothetical protein